MQLKWKSQHFLGFPFLLSLVSVLGIKKFHISTSTSAIILKIQIKKYFLFFSIFSHFLGNQTVQQIQEMSFQAQNFPGISKAAVLETNRNSSLTLSSAELEIRLVIPASKCRCHSSQIATSWTRQVQSTMLEQTRMNQTCNRVLVIAGTGGEPLTISSLIRAASNDRTSIPFLQTTSSP